MRRNIGGNLWREGHCGTTNVGEGVHCAPFDTRGSWRASTAAACVERCNQCSRCAAVSFSANFNDCSWYAACDLSALVFDAEADTRHKTQRVRNNTVRTESIHPMCPLGNGERIFSGIVQALLTDRRLMRDGAVLDVGANNGETACQYASFVPERLVHAVDPDKANIARMKRLYGRNLPNLRPRLGGMGSRSQAAWTQPTINRWGQMELDTEHLQMEDAPETRTPGDAGRHDSSQGGNSYTFAIYRLDELFESEALAFAHIDVEGSELEVLRGGARTLARDRFLFTFEIHARATAVNVPLLQMIDAFGYQILAVHEVCGARLDCRNLLALPPWCLPYTNVPILRLMVDSGRVVPLKPPFDNASVPAMLHALAPSVPASRTHGRTHLVIPLCRPLGASQPLCRPQILHLPPF